MNVGYLIGHNTVRKNIMGLENRTPSSEELDKMKQQIIMGMDEGAFGISTGLKYLPGNFSQIDEVISLSKEASKKGGIYTSHLRDEGLNVISVPVTQDDFLASIKNVNRSVGNDDLQSFRDWMKEFGATI